jgi:hypothetical protein
VAAYLNKYGTYWQKQAFEEKYGNKGEWFAYIPRPLFFLAFSRRFLSS